MARTLSALLALVLLAAPLRAQDEVSDEYRVKAAFLFNFLKYVEWPPSAADGPMRICVAGRNPFGKFLEETVKDESINGRMIETRVILEPEGGCHLLFVPTGAASTAYLRALRGEPTLTVGERPDFIGQGGIISFSLVDGNVRFTINPAAAERAKLRVSSRLLELARIANDDGEVR
jgi:hypothetical protein